MKKSYDELRESYKTFIYKSYSIAIREDRVHITYHFEVPGLAEFSPEWIFEGRDIEKSLQNKTFETMVFSLGMVELVSYWKIACPPKVIVEAGYLDEWQRAWWKDEYYNGLGEFFYTNHIELDPIGFMDITSTGKPIEGAPSPLVGGDMKVMIPVGGGKDSVVTMEVAKQTNCEMNAYIINPRGATVATAAIAGFDKPFIAKRTLDKEMLRLNDEGFLNGHTPFSAIVAFSSILAAYMNGMKYVILSNESSANESTVKGSSVNHQYSKSFKFEEDFNNYEEKYIGSGVKYFSLLRPLSEFQIAGLFASYKEYHSAFRSCNAGSKQDIWCGHCPKCLFVFIILSPFLPYEEVVKIFDRDMLDDGDMKEDLYKLIGMTDEKPFECVGSRDEINMALILTIEKFTGELPLLLKLYKNTPLYEEYRRKKNRLFDFYDTVNFLPQIFDTALREECVKKGVLIDK